MEDRLPNETPFNLPTDPDHYPVFENFDGREDYIRKDLRDDYKYRMENQLTQEMEADPVIQERLYRLVELWSNDNNFRDIEFQRYYVNRGDSHVNDGEENTPIARERAQKAKAEQELEERERLIETRKGKHRAAHVPMPPISGISGQSIYYQPAADYQPERPTALDDPVPDTQREPLLFPSRWNGSLERGDPHREPDFLSRINLNLLFTSRWNPTLERRGDAIPESSLGMRGGIGDTSESNRGMRGGIEDTSESSLGKSDTVMAEYRADAGGRRPASRSRSPQRSPSPQSGVRSWSEYQEMIANPRGGDRFSERSSRQRGRKTSRPRAPSPDSEESTRGTWRSGGSGAVCGSGSTPMRPRVEQQAPWDTYRYSKWRPSERSTLGRRSSTPPGNYDSWKMDSDSSTESNAPAPRSQQEENEFRDLAYHILAKTARDLSIAPLIRGLSIAFVGYLSASAIQPGFETHRGDLIISHMSSRHIGLPNSVGYIASYMGEPYTFTPGPRDLVLRVGNFNVDPPRGAFPGRISYNPFTYVELYGSAPNRRMSESTPWQFLGHQAELLDGNFRSPNDISPGKFLRVGTPVLGPSSDAVEALVPRRGDIIIKREVWVEGFDHATNFWYSMVKWHRGRRFHFFSGDMLVRRLVDSDRRGNWGWAELYTYEGISVGWVFWGRTQHIYDSPWPERKKNVILYEYDHGTDSDDEIEKERANPRGQDSS